jgi:hypothetical protein
MEFPILNELHLPETCLRLIKQFLWEPHPTAVLIKGLTFERGFVEWEDPNDAEIRAVFSVFGPHVRRLMVDSWYTHRFTHPLLHPLEDDFWQEFGFSYDDSTGEDHCTDQIAFRRRSTWRNDMRNERGLERRCCP